MQPAKCDVRAFLSIVVGNRISPLRRSDVHLNHYQVRLVVQFELLDVLILQLDRSARRQIAGKRGEPKRRKQRVLDWPKEGAYRFGERRKDHFDFHLGVSPVNKLRGVPGNASRKTGL